MNAADIAHSPHIIGHLCQAIAEMINHEGRNAFGLQVLD